MRGCSRVHTYSIAQHSSPYCAGSMVCFGFLFWKVLTYKVLGCVQTGATLLTNNSQHCWMLHVASVCTPCYMLLDVVACCCAKFETGQTFQPTTPNISFVLWSPKRSATMLDPFAQLFQHCWGRASSLRMVYKDLWVVSIPRCTAGPNIVGSCCIRLLTTASTHATTPNIVAQQCRELLRPFARSLTLLSMKLRKETCSRTARTRWHLGVYMYWLLLKRSRKKCLPASYCSSVLHLRCIEEPQL